MPINCGPTPITSVQKGSKYTLTTSDAHEIALPRQVKEAILALPIRFGGAAVAVAAGHAAAPFEEDAGTVAVETAIDTRIIVHMDGLIFAASIAASLVAQRRPRAGHTELEPKLPTDGSDEGADELGAKIPDDHRGVPLGRCCPETGKKGQKK